ncbi:hypothetical protein TCAL_11859 [Tigriopus californicus]|uniref:Transporter n=1 Tax=Tigriopus californicus TaxID=6832 RepID=A0A553PGK7_TIGCA|nr:sodium- and chloride-dependent glycine transporter 1-like [Tigriopus californicus]TRY76813.1 hypothetical protein TCAL_11859 [Tigriopus californicus]|eukprot:TCALIF_11859-PA protein Name:"Similar to Slc6a5 Sodium- and chloride-dependent glycine transporter 2 (Mus musculus)" AED:0.20 eAED:0.20 QI:231/1/1/1/1/1/12/499/659
MKIKVFHQLQHVWRRDSEVPREERINDVHVPGHILPPEDPPKSPLKVVSELESSNCNSNVPERAEWGSQFEFMLSCLSFAVGLGNIWRFPYLCYRNGGGAFLIPYALNIFLTGIPLFFMELSFGQFASKSPVAIWCISPLFQGIGLSMFLISFGVGLYYNVIVAWALYYFGATLSSLFDDDLPWVTCSNWWNTKGCQELHDVSRNMTGKVPENYDSAAQEYFTRNVLELSPGLEDLGGMRWQLVFCLFLAWAIVFLVLYKGVKSLGKMVYFTSLFPYFILTLLLIKGLSLHGAMDGIWFYIKPDFSKLLEVQCWADAAIQIFFSLGPCWGALITLSSYNKFSNNCFRDAIVIGMANCATSFFAGFVVFSFVGFMAYELQKPVSEVVASGPGLAFVVYPEAVSLLPGSKIWALLFFLMLLALGFGTQFSILETVTSIVVDAWPKRWGKANHQVVLGCACTTGFVLGLCMVTRGGMYILQLLDNHAGTFSALITGVCEVVVLAWIYGVDRFLGDIQIMFQWNTKTKAYKLFHCFWKTMWRFVTPMLLLLILVATWAGYKPMTYDKYVYPMWANGLGWVVSFISVAAIPLVMLSKIITTPGPLSERISKLIKPDSNWGPLNEGDYQNAQDGWEENGFLEGKEMIDMSKDEGNTLLNSLDAVC